MSLPSDGIAHHRSSFLTVRALIAEETRHRETIDRELSLVRARWVVAMADSAAEAAKKQALRGGSLRPLRGFSTIATNAEKHRFENSRRALAHNVVASALSNALPFTTSKDNHSLVVYTQRPKPQGAFVSKKTDNQQLVSPLTMALLKLSDPQRLDAILPNDLVTSSPPGDPDLENESSHKRVMTPFERLKRRAANELRSQLGDEATATVLNTIGGRHNTDSKLVTYGGANSEQSMHQKGGGGGGEAAMASDPDLESAATPFILPSVTYPYPKPSTALTISETSLPMLQKGQRQHAKTGTTARQRLLADPNFLLSHKAKLAMFAHVYQSSSVVVRQLTDRKRQMQREEEISKTAELRRTQRSPSPNRKNDVPLLRAHISTPTELPPLRSNQAVRSPKHTANKIYLPAPDVPARYLADYEKAKDVRIYQQTQRDTRSKAFRYRLDERDWWKAESMKMEPASSPPKLYLKVEKALLEYQSCKSGQQSITPTPAADEPLQQPT